MAANFYFSTDAGAPTLSGTAGTLISVLDACLVNGYGSKSGAGWTKAFSGVNLAAYRMSTASPATGFYLRVDDSNATASRIIGYETMTDVNTGTGPFPTNAQFANGLFAIKSSAAGATARPWAVVAENRSFYLFILGNVTTFGAGDTWNCTVFFGDIITRKAVDGYNCALIANSTASNQSQQMGTVNSLGSYSDITAHYLARDYTGIGGSKQFGKCRAFKTWGAYSNILGGPESSTTFPDPISQTWNLARVMVMESAIVMRGFLPGLYDNIGGVQVGNWWDIIPGQGSFSGTSFLMVPVVATTNNVSRAAIQITGNWY